MNEDRKQSERRIKILLVDDDEAFVSDMTPLMMERYEMSSARTGSEALAVFKNGEFDVVLLDIGLGRGMDGFEVLKRLRESAPDLPVIMVTGNTSSAYAVKAMKIGATDYIDKKPDLKALEKIISSALNNLNLSKINRALREDLDVQTGTMVGKSEPMKSLRREIRFAAETSSPVLIVGETGTGKELVAREIHRLYSPDAPFVAKNCAAVPQHTLDMELVGSVPGAFTDAKFKQGWFEIAGEGILFLDEITEIEPYLQSKLLRIVEERVFQRLSENRNIHFKGKILASTNQDIQKAIAEGKLRQDLYYRFSTFVIQVPPLRERRGDIRLLSEHFIREIARELKKPAPILSDDLLTRICSHDWPGNVRDLKNAIERYIISGTFSFQIEEPEPIEQSTSGAGVHCIIPQHIFTMSYKDAKRGVVQYFKRKYIETILAACDGDVREAAKRMGSSRYGLQKMMKELGM